MNTDKTKSLLDVALDVRKEHQHELEEKTAGTEASEPENSPVKQPSGEPNAT